MLGAKPRGNRERRVVGERMFGRAFVGAFFAVAVVVLGAVNVGAANGGGSLRAGPAPAPSGFPGSSGPPSEAIEASRAQGGSPARILAK